MMDTGLGIVIFGILYVVNTIIGIALTGVRDRWLQKARFEAEKEQAKIMSHHEMKVDLKAKSR